MGGQLGCQLPQNHDGPHEELAPPPRCYCDRPAVRLGDRFVCPLPDTRNYCTFGREDRMRIVPRFGIPAALAPKPCN